jgi:hypothetical protein
MQSDFKWVTVCFSVVGLFWSYFSGWHFMIPFLHFTWHTE